MKNKYKGFTLVEMLVVMGILMILMAVGITSGRYAIQRANDIAHKDAADDIWDALVGYYTDKRIYPEKIDDCSGASVAAGTQQSINTKDLVNNCIKNYLDGAFDGGSSSTYYYIVASNRQSAVVCVSLGGVDDESGRGYYCTGNGFNDQSLAEGKFTQAEVDSDATKDDASGVLQGDAQSFKSNWNGKDWESN